MKRSGRGREGLWADIPSARIRFAAEAAFLIVVAGGAALAQLSPPAIIGLMLVAWLLVALIERASSREQARALAGAEEAEMPSMPAAELAEEARPEVAFRRFFGRRHRVAVEPLPAPAGSLDERPSRAHVRRIEPEPPPPAIEPELETVVAEVVVSEPSPAEPAVTKRPLELPGLEEPESARATAQPSTEAQAPLPAPPPEPAPVERAPPPPPEPPRAPPAPRPPAREWNIWDLERRARKQAGNAERNEEWAALFIHLRQYANADGVLPMQFDDLVRESFSDLIQAA